MVSQAGVALPMRYRHQIFQRDLPGLGIHPRDKKRQTTQPGLSTKARSILYTKMPDVSRQGGGKAEPSCCCLEINALDLISSIYFLPW